MIRKTAVMITLLFFGLFTAGAAAPEDEQETPASHQVTVYDEASLFGNDRISSMSSGTGGLDDYDLILLVVEGLGESNYDRNVYDYAVDNLSDEEGFISNGLDDNSILMSISPDIRKLGVYGGSAVNLSPEDVDFAVNAMVPSAREGQWRNVVFEGFNALSYSMNGMAPATQTNGSQGSGSMENTGAFMMAVVGGGGVIIALLVGGSAAFNRISARREASKTRKLAADDLSKNIAGYESFWRSINRTSMSLNDQKTTDFSKEALDRIKKTREPSMSAEEKDEHRVWLFTTANPSDSKNIAIKSDLDFYSRQPGWESRWEKEVSRAEEKVVRAEESMIEFAQMAKNKSDVDRARDAILLARGSVEETDKMVRKSKISVENGQKRLVSEVKELKDAVQKIGRSSEIVEGVESRRLSRRENDDFNFAHTTMLFWGVATIATAKTSTSYSSSSDSFSSYTPTSFTSFGGGSFSGGSGSF